MARILVVEDEEPISDILKYALERDGYQVHTVDNGVDAVRAARDYTPDLILLDVMLPEKDGFEVSREVRAFSSVPIIMLTARESEIDKILGLELGADDYVTKPFSTRELLARVKANLRRTWMDAAEQETDESGESLTIGDLNIDLEKYEVKRQGEVIALTHREFQLLSFLATRPGIVYTREQLLSEVWGLDYYGDARTIDVTVRRLREKLETDASNPDYVLTRRGVGYYVKR